MRRLQIEWDRPSTLAGVDITYYTIEVEGIIRTTSGSDNEISVDFPYLNASSCQNQTICTAATTLAGISNFTCIEAFLIESEYEMKVMCMHCIFHV